jgi:acetoin utilization deacetylase AcuC-like enzyme
VGIEPRAADVEDLRMVHTDEHIFRVQRVSSEREESWLDPDTPVCPASFDVARAAVGGAFVAILVVGVLVMFMGQKMAAKSAA